MCWMTDAAPWLAEGFAEPVRGVDREGEGVRRFFFALRSRADVGAAIERAFSISPAAFDGAFAAMCGNGSLCGNQSNRPLQR